MEAVVFVGIQATGKSTFCQQRFFRTHVRINLDMLRTRRREEILVRACLEAKQPFVVDNTNPTVKDRTRYIGLAKTAGFRVVGYYFQSSVSEALERNAWRPERERVPEIGIRGTHSRLEIPSFDEGFDALYYVRIGERGEFELEEWADEAR
jgi:predicted kinase